MVWDCFSRSLFFFSLLYSGKIESPSGRGGLSGSQVFKMQVSKAQTELPQHDRNRIWCKKQANSLDVSWAFSPLLHCQTPLCLFSASSSFKLPKLLVSLNLDILPKKGESPKEVRKENENLFLSFQGLFFCETNSSRAVPSLCVLICLFISAYMHCPNAISLLSLSPTPSLKLHTLLTPTVFLMGWQW